MKRSALPLASALLLGLALFAGCSTISSRVRSHQPSFDSATADQKALILQGRLALGFTKEMVLMALGQPDRILVRTDAQGSSERWLYFTPSPASLSFDEGPWWDTPLRRHHGLYRPVRYRPVRPMIYPAPPTEARPDTSVRFQDDKVVDFEQTKR